jgi:hypothetical protein
VGVVWLISAWTVIAFTFTGYILSFIIDLLPSTQKHSDSRHEYQQLEMDMSSSRLMIWFVFFSCTLVWK